MKKANKPTMAMIYCRTACSPAEGRDDAILEQEAECRAYATTHGLVINGVLHDRGKGGMRIGHPGWEAMMQFLGKTSTPHYVLVRDISRLAREPDLCGMLEAACRKLGHTVIGVHDHKDKRLTKLELHKLNLFIEAYKGSRSLRL